MAVDYGLLSANLNLPVEQMVSIVNQNNQAKAQLGLQAAQMRQQASMQAAQLAQKRIADENQIKNQQQMQQAEIAARQALQANQLAASAADAQLPYNQMTQGQKVQLMGYQDAERERQFKNQQAQLDYQRQLANDAAKQKWEMAKLQYDQMSPKSAEAKFAHDFANEKDPLVKQIMMEQKAAEAAKNNQTVSYGRDANGNVTVSVAKGGSGGAGSGQGFGNKVQEENLGNKLLLSDLDNIEKSWKPQFSTSSGQLKYDAILKAQRMGLPTSLADKKTVNEASEYASWGQQVNQYFNQYRKEITGAGASNTELEKLEKSTINSNQGPQEFKAALQQAKSKMARYVEIRNQAMNAGLTPGTPAFSAYVDRSGWYASTPADNSKALSRFEVK